MTDGAPPAAGSARPARGDGRLTTYIMVIVVEVVVLCALWLFSRHFG